MRVAGICCFHVEIARSSGHDHFLPVMTSAGIQWFRIVRQARPPARGPVMGAVQAVRAAVSKVGE